MALIFSAWLMTFAKWFPIPGIDGKFDFATMLCALVVATLDEDLWDKMF